MDKERTNYDAILERLDIPDIEKLLASLGTGVQAGLLLTVNPGDTVRVTASFAYRGPAFTDTFYVAIGNRVVAFDEIWVGSKPISIPQSIDFVTYTQTVDILITPVGRLPWTPSRFDIYAKLSGNLGAGLPEIANVIEVLLKGEFQNFQITGYDKV